MTDYYEHYDEINAELQRMAAISIEEESPSRKLYIGSGEDFDVKCAFEETEY